MNAKKFRIGGAVFITALLTFGISGVAQADTCQIWGNGTAAENIEDPEMGLWRYTMDISWEIDGQHALSHMNVILALGECPCLCEDFSFAVHDTAGASTGYIDRSDPCTAYYGAEFNCQGDPSIGLDDPLIKFEDMEDLCEPALLGTGTFVFYTDWPPAPTTQPNVQLAMKAGQDLVCFGELTGDLPLCDCATPTYFGTWGRLKTLYR